MRHLRRTVAETLEKLAVKTSCWIRQILTEMRPMRAGTVAAAVAVCGIEGWNQGAKRVPVKSCGLLGLVLVCDSRPDVVYEL